jgi:hypothetical protein
VTVATLTDREKADTKTLIRFISIFCREKHGGEKTPFSFKRLKADDIPKGEVALCPDCTRLLKYALTMRLKCPHDPKPMCKKCETQCYNAEYKEKIREIMKFSGTYMIMHGRLDMLYHYLR